MFINKFYSSLRHDAKMSFWPSFTNVILVVFTFWMGLAVQDMIAGKTAKYNAQKVKIDHVLPMYRELSNSELITRFFNLEEVKTLLSKKNMSDQESKLAINKLIEYLKSNLLYSEGVKKDIEKSVEIMSVFRYYASSDDFDKVTYNNTVLLFCLRLIDKLEQNPNLSDAQLMQFTDAYLHSAECRNYAHFAYGDSTEVGKKLVEIVKESGATLTILSCWGAILKCYMGNFEIISQYISPEKDSFWGRPVGVLCIGILILVVVAYITMAIIHKNSGVVSILDYKEKQRAVIESETTILVLKKRIEELEKMKNKMQDTIDINATKLEELQSENTILRERISTQEL